MTANYSIESRGYRHMCKLWVGDSGTFEELWEGHGNWGQTESKLELQREGSPRSRGALLTILKILTFIPRAIGSHWKVLWGFKKNINDRKQPIQQKGEDFKNYN